MVWRCCINNHLFLFQQYYDCIEKLIYRSQQHRSAVQKKTDKLNESIQHRSLFEIYPYVDLTYQSYFGYFRLLHLHFFAVLQHLEQILLLHYVT